MAPGQLVIVLDFDARRHVAKTSRVLILRSRTGGYVRFGWKADIRTVGDLAVLPEDLRGVEGAAEWWAVLSTSPL